MIAPLWLILWATRVILPTDAAAVVDLGYAKYQGTSYHDPLTNKTNTQFLSIRFAAPPTGPLRFRAPQPPVAIPGITVADTTPPACLQSGWGAAPTTPFRDLGLFTSMHNGSVAGRHLVSRQALSESEDCLFLNVYVPGNVGDKKNLPVVFWIHGGGYVTGNTAPFNGNDLIREAGGNVVAVITQYRVGAFGFLPGQKVKAGGDLNAGLLDQQFAMQWVQKNIRLFGGDPKKVTIWGESAGAGSVLQHIIANGGKTSPPLFRAAITSSTYVPSQYRYNDPIPEAIFSKFASLSGCPTGSLTCLRNKDIDTLQAANTEVNSLGFFGTFVFGPVVDGTFIRDRPSASLSKGKFNGKTLLSVVNSFEGTIFVDQSTASTVKIVDYVKNLFPPFTSAQAWAVAQQYQGTGSNIEQAISIMGESLFTCPTYTLIKAFRGRSFKGQFAIPPAYHGEDLAYYFPNGATPKFANEEFNKAFPQSFLNFVMGLNPNDKFDTTNTMPAWPLFDGSKEMLFNKTTADSPDIRVVNTDPGLRTRCSFWESISTLTSQ